VSAGDRSGGELARRSAAPLVAALIVVGGTLVATFPQHTVSVLRVLAVCVVVVVAGTAGLAVVGADHHDDRTSIGSDSVFERPSARAVGRLDPPGLGPIRASLVEASVPEGRRLSPGAERRLEAVARWALERAGIDLDDAAQANAVRASVAPDTWAVLSAFVPPPQGVPPPPPLRRRPRRARPRDAANAAAVTSEVVHTVLDDLDRLAGHQSPGGGAR
jgi:hypothetical protein